MKKIENYEEVQASTGEILRPTQGGYICRIVVAYDKPLDPATNKGDYLTIEYDIADGEFKNYYMEAHQKFGGNWWAKFIRSYKDSALGMFKHFMNCVEQSNPNYTWDWDETKLIGKYVGLVLGLEEYEKMDGTIGTRLYVKDVKTVEDIKNGNFKVPELKKLKIQEPKFTPIEDDSECPF